jgi:hypothetical protein
MIPVQEWIERRFGDAKKKPHAQSVRRYLMLGLVVLLSGCAKRSIEVANEGSVRMNVVTPTTVRLEDGTRCAVIFGYREPSIDCDWRAK